MKQTAVVIAPGRGTYNKAELGYLSRHYPNDHFIAKFDAARALGNQPSLSELDGAKMFKGAIHTRGDNASPLIFGCAWSDFGAIDRNRYDIIAVTGNSMGWYIALACAGAVSPENGFRITNTMGTLMQEHMIGGQIVYPLVDENWQEIPGKRRSIMETIAAIHARKNHHLSLSIDLGGMLVLAGNDLGLAGFEATVPAVQGRYPMRLQNHAGFHSTLQNPVSRLGLALLPLDLFQQPDVPMIDGQGRIWYPKATDPEALYEYTLGTQVTQPYDFARAISTAAYEFMPDVFIVLGPGTTLGGASAQSLIKCGWRGWTSKSDLPATPSDIRLLSMGQAEHRQICV